LFKEHEIFRQIMISAEIKEIGKGLNAKRDVEKVSEIVYSIITRAEQLQQPTGGFKTNCLSIKINL
jgi:hypothetical protein